MKDKTISVSFCPDGHEKFVKQIADALFLDCLINQKQGEPRAEIRGGLHEIVLLLNQLDGSFTSEITVHSRLGLFRFSSFGEARDFILREESFQASIVKPDTSLVLHSKRESIPTRFPYSYIDKSYETPEKVPGYWSFLFGRKRNPSGDEVHSSVFAPKQVKKGRKMLVQVYLYKDKERSETFDDAVAADSDAERRGNALLDLPIHIQDTVRIQVSFAELAFTGIEDVIWKGRLRKVAFKVPIPGDAPEEFFGEVTVSVNPFGGNGDFMPIGKMVFKTETLSSEECFPLVNAEISAEPYRNVFISYAHKDVDKINYLVEGYRSLGQTVNFFYDKDVLRPGDDFPDQIYKYIDNADLFVLCWSENAANSLWVQREKDYALQRYRREGGSRLKLYPISISPHTDLPLDMRDKFHFGVVN